MLEQRGSALVQVLLLSVLLLNVIILSLANHINNNRKLSRIMENSDLRAYEVAKAGAIESITFFRKQPMQPVKEFNPTHNDSENPNVGIVRTINIFSRTNNLIGRYEINRNRVQDVSIFYGKPRGTIWAIYSRGLVIRRDTNQVISSKTIAFLIRRIAINIPYEATIIWNRISNVKLESRTRLISSSINIAGSNGTGSPVIQNQSAILPYSINYVTDYYTKVNFNNIFGMTFDEMKALADFRVTNSNDFPRSSAQNPISGKIIVIDTTNPITLEPFYGSGIIISRASITIQNTRPINFNGVIYMMPNTTLTIQCPGMINGVIISDRDNNTGEIKLNNQSGGDYLLVQYDPVIINQLKQQIGNYRFYSNFWEVD